MQQKLFNNSDNIALEDIFRAYYDCRKNKRNNLDALKYELDFEEDLICLWKEINNKNYEISPLDVFIVNKPVKREIFAAKFRDRIVHHLVINKINYLFEREFIYDSYSCQVDKGTHFGINRIDRFMRQCSENYQKDCWILKLDIKGYFMHINKNILLEKLNEFIDENYKFKDKNTILWLCKKIINNDPTKNCRRKSPKSKWKRFPKQKSLFYSPKNCGLPVGNYTSQVFANFYLNSLDHFIKCDLKMRYYGRYVDDLVVISEDKDRLRKLIPIIKDFLKKELELDVHPKKIYLQHFSKGTEFLGVLIKPYRKYVSCRIKNNFLQKIEAINNKLSKKEFSEEEKAKIVSQINSYLGTLKHYNTYNLRMKFFKSLDKKFWEFFDVDTSFTKVFTMF